MTTSPRDTVLDVRPALLRAIDCITVPVPDIDSGLAFYQDKLGQELLWRNDELDQAGLRLPDSDAELVLTTREDYAPGWLVTSADQAAETIRVAGGRVLTEPISIPVGRLAVVADPFGNVLLLLDLSKGTYITDGTGAVTGTTARPPPARSS